MVAIGRTGIEAQRNQLILHFEHVVIAERKRRQICRRATRRQ